ncbi:MAG: BatD family protein [Schleiferiaceae bacterium]|nr:BatD family protein [Schleiferiaceae bacterium]
MVSFKNIGLLALALLASVLLNGQTQFIAKADRYTVGKNEQFTVTFTINDQASKFAAPDFGDFQVVQGPMTSQNTVIQNFEMVVQLSYTYILRPRRVGNFTISAASIQVGGEKLYTKPLDIKVVERSPQADDPNDPQNLARKLAYTRIKVSKRSVFVGEPFVATYQLLTRVNVGNPSELEAINYSNAYKKDIEQKSQNRPEQEIIDGEAYQVFTLKQHLIIPQKAGSFSPGTVTWEIPTQIPTNQRDFFGRQMVQTIKQVSEARFPSVEVKSLPRENRPANFSGGVGKLKFDVKASRTEVKANESVVLTLELSGEGNIKLTDMPKIDIPAAIEAFDPKFSERINETASGMSGSKKQEFLLLPRFKGTYKIPSITFSYFDLNSKTYKTIESEEINITVLDGPTYAGGGSNSSTSPNPTKEKENVTYLDEDILFIKTTTDTISVKTLPFAARKNAVYYILLYPFFMALLGVLLLLYKKVNNNSPEKRAKRARAYLKKQFMLLENLANNGDSNGFYAKLSNELWSYFEILLAIPKSEQSIETLERRLKDLELPDSEIARIIKLFTRCEMVKYSPAAVSNMKNDLEEAKDLVAKLENQ